MSVCLERQTPKPIPTVSSDSSVEQPKEAGAWQSLASQVFDESFATVEKTKRKRNQKTNSMTDNDTNNNNIKPTKRMRKSSSSTALFVDYKGGSDEADSLSSTEDEISEFFDSDVFHQYVNDDGDENDQDCDNDKNVPAHWQNSRQHQKWEEKFQLLVEYQAKNHGNTRVSSRYPILGTWVRKQRLKHKRGKLLHYRKERLDSIGFEWDNYSVWEEKFQLLWEYQRQHGTTLDPESGTILGNWVRKQRIDHKRGTLSKCRWEKLDSIGFVWDLCPDDRLWRNMYSQLLCYKEEHDGSTNVPKGFAENKKLARWVQAQRKDYNQKSLSQERIELLESIGFEWDPVHNQWMTMYQKLIEYKTKYGDTCVPRQWNEDPQLSKWVHDQRRCKGDQNRVNLLENIGFVWDLTNHQWMTMYQKLVNYKEKYGNTCVPHRWNEDLQLGAWVNNQRRCKDERRIKLLNDIGFHWESSNHHQWLVMYQKLKEYKREYGDTRVPHRWNEDRQLGAWVRNQRRCKNEHHIRLLNEIGFVWKTTNPNMRRTKKSAVEE